MVGCHWNCELRRSLGLRFGKSRNVLHENIRALIKRLEMASLLLVKPVAALGFSVAIQESLRERRLQCSSNTFPAHRDDCVFLVFVVHQRLFCPLAHLSAPTQRSWFTRVLFVPSSLP